MSFLKQLFTWWHRQTFGTFVYTLIFGRFVGEDEFGNKYYSDSKEKKRWVIYKKRVESTKIPPNWHSWIHFQTKNKPNLKRQLFSWQKQHEENLTGTKRAHIPDCSMLNNEKKDMKKYETWKN